MIRRKIITMSFCRILGIIRRIRNLVRIAIEIAEISRRRGRNLARIEIKIAMRIVIRITGIIIRMRI